jgi:hypothetical protein
MTWLSKTMAMFLALVWLPVASHCDLEHLPGLEFLACCDHADTAPHQDDDCETDLCASVESGICKTEEQGVSAPFPDLWPALLAARTGEEWADSAAPRIATTSDAIELPQRWLFLHRAALPVRAPSFAS